MVQPGTGGRRHFFPARASPGPPHDAPPHATPRALPHAPPMMPPRDPPTEARLQQRALLRRAGRALRRGLEPAQRRSAQQAAARHFLSLLRLRTLPRVAGYLAAPGEFDPAPLLAAAQRRGARLYVPRLSRVHAAGMGFAPLAPPLRRNRYGLLEPAALPSISLQYCNVVLVPLVAFDRRGCRLGMGGGYYDRALAFRQRRERWRGPLLIGVAFGVQEVAQIPDLPWDVRLDAILTDNGWIKPLEQQT
jgi:5-formyltetrahydrofolate cyclo-ligase